MYDELFVPIQLAGLTISHRVVRTAHGTGLFGEDLISYHEARAKGGVALSIIGAAGVHATSATADVPVHKDSVLGLYEKMSERLHAHGMKVFQQLWHGGSAYNPPPGVIQWSSSQVPNPMTGRVPRAMTIDMIDEVVASFGLAAARVKQGGLDGVEIHAAHNYLVGQFLSPALNRREDEYGGSLRNRMRFLIEVIAAVRAQVGPEFPIGVRLVGDEFIEGGLDGDEAAQIAQTVQRDVDFVDVSLGGYWRFHQMMATMESPLGYELSSSQLVTAAVDVPTIVTGRIMTLDHANHIVASGQADMVSMVRALIADPDLVNKSRSAREAEIRPCIGTNEGCVAGHMTGRFRCVVNVAAGREATVAFDAPDVASTSKRVLVVGGGPAGMEAARTAALRGHHVELHELRRELGGQVAIAATVRERSDLVALTRWLADELKRLGVKVRRNSFVDPDMVIGSGADEVIIATGGTPMLDVPQAAFPASRIPGSELAHVYTSWDILGSGGPSRVGHQALIFDDTGNFEAITVALWLVSRSVPVTFVTRHDALGANVLYPAATVAGAKEILMRGQVEIVASSCLEQISPSSVAVRSADGARQRVFSADTVIICGYHHPNRELSEALVSAGVRHHVIGDANGTQDLRRAISEAALVARAL